MNLDDALKKIMTPLVYARSTHETPYCYTLAVNGGTLGYFGAHHTNKPSDELFTELHDFFETVRPDVVYVEGMSDVRVQIEVATLVPKISFSEAIVQGGEPLYTVKLAVEHGIPWESPEPLDGELYQYLLSEGFKKYEIAAADVLMLLPQWQRRDELMNFKDYVVPFIAQFKAATKWTDIPYTYEAAMETVEAITGKPLDIHDEVRAERLADPIPWPRYKDRQTVFNALAAAHSRFRDEYMIRHFVAPLLASKRVLVVYGASHAVMQEPALRALAGGE